MKSMNQVANCKKRDWCNCKCWSQFPQCFSPNMLSTNHVLWKILYCLEKLLMALRNTIIILLVFWESHGLKTFSMFLTIFYLLSLSVFGMVKYRFYSFLIINISYLILLEVIFNIKSRYVWWHTFLGISIPIL